MTEIEELAATVASLLSRVTALETRLPAPRAALRQLEPEGACVTEHIERIPPLPPGEKIDLLFEAALRERAALLRLEPVGDIVWVNGGGLLARGNFRTKDLRRGFAEALQFIISKTQLGEVDKTKNLSKWFDIVEDWYFGRRESGSSISAPAFLLAAFAAGIPVEVGRDVWTTFIGLSEQPGQTAPIQRSAAA
jgi:hypothetical protein